MNRSPVIAVVRIAPLEQWCDAVRETTTDDVARKIVGMEIKIDASSMQNPGPAKGIDCGGKIWHIIPESVRAMNEKADVESTEDNAWPCEHILEMD